MRNGVIGGSWFGGDALSEKFTVNGSDGEGTGGVEGKREARFAATLRWSIPGIANPSCAGAEEVYMDGVAGQGEAGFATTFASFPLGIFPSGAGGACLRGRNW